MTREEAIARIKDHIVVHRYLERNAVKLLEALDMAIKALEESEHPGWIPCSKELPKKDGYYYVTNYNGQTARCLFIKGITEEFWIQYVTAWMPLPQPYKGGSK